LLYDTGSVYEDQLIAARKATSMAGTDIDLSLITDGLAAEREQGITIDVAYRYFTTAKRQFIIADTPGHVQYTRNMVTGASTAAGAILLIDERPGVRPARRSCGGPVTTDVLVVATTVPGATDIPRWRYGGGTQT